MVFKNGLLYFELGSTKGALAAPCRFVFFDILGKCLRRQNFQKWHPNLLELIILFWPFMPFKNG
jgi:hypothetical protein